MLYTVSEMAKLLDIPPSTIRYYDKEGLIPFVERSASGIRMFKESDYEYLKIINCLKQSGMRLKDIKTFIQMVMKGDETIEQRLQLFQKQKETVEKQIKELQEILNIVNFKCWYYEKAKEAGTTSVPYNMKADEIPEEYREVRTNLRRFQNIDGDR